MDKKKILKEFLRKNKLAVLSTVSSGKPQSAVLEFSETDDLEIVFDTLSTSRKYKNLKNDKNVSLVIGWDENVTVQYEGEANELSGAELEKCKNIYFEKNFTNSK